MSFGDKFKDLPPPTSRDSLPPPPDRWAELEERIRAREGSIPPEAPKRHLGVSIRYLAEISPQKVEYRWRPRIPLGQLTMLDGDPEKAKSTIMLELAAR